VIGPPEAIDPSLPRFSIVAVTNYNDPPADHI
jgi:hypothetical protein